MKATLFILSLVIWLASSAQISAKSLGAKGDSLTDDTKALTKWLSAGNNLYLDSGVYIISSQVLSKVPRSNVTIQGGGGKIIVTDKFNHSTSVLRLENISGLTIRDLIIEQNGSRDDNNVFATIGERTMASIRLENCRDVLIDRCTFLDVAKCAVRAANTPYLTIQNCKVLDTWGYGFGAFYCDHVTFENNTVTGKEGITYPALRMGNDGSGVGIEAGWSDHVQIVSNHIDNIANTGSKTEGCNHVKYIGNTVLRSGKDGIKVQASPDYNISFVYDATVIGNTVEYLRPLFYDGSSLIQLWDVKGFVVTGNNLKGGKKGVTKSGYESGIKVFSSYPFGASDGVVADNTIQTVGHTGVYVLNAENVSIDNNILSGYGIDFDVHGIWLNEVRNSSLTNNRIRRGKAVVKAKPIYKQLSYGIKDAGNTTN